MALVSIGPVEPESRSVLCSIHSSERMDVEDVSGSGGKEGSDDGGDGASDDSQKDLGASSHAANESFDGMSSLDSYAGEHQVVEHSPQGRYVRFNVKFSSGAVSKEVWKAYDTSEGVEVAWNTLCMRGIPRQDKQRIIHEIKILEKLDHPNIISFYTSWYNREQKQIVFITELMNTGSLMEFVEPIPVLRWKIVKKWASQILAGLAHLHEQKIIHRNINCENIFIVANKGLLKIGDLGLSTVSQKAASCVGTAPFMAPELFEEGYDEKVDIYAFGMTILQMITKETPYCECEAVSDIYRRVVALVPPAALKRVVNASARNFIELCLCGDPVTRPSAQELLAHPFLQPNKEVDSLDVVLAAALAGGSASSANSYLKNNLSHQNSLAALPSSSTMSGSSLQSYMRRGDSMASSGGPPTWGTSTGSMNTSSGGSSSAAPFAGAQLQQQHQQHQQQQQLLQHTLTRSASGQAPTPMMAANGSKLHMRFFSEPHGSLSELSDDESDVDWQETGGCKDERDMSIARLESGDDDLSLHTASTRPAGGPSSPKSPRSAWKEEDRNEDDDLLSDLPEAESTCKRVKVMSSRSSELVDESSESQTQQRLSPDGRVAAPSPVGPPTFHPEPQRPIPQQQQQHAQPPTPQRPQQQQQPRIPQPRTPQRQQQQQQRPPSPPRDAAKAPLAETPSAHEHRATPAGRLQPVIEASASSAAQAEAKQQQRPLGEPVEDARKEPEAPTPPPPTQTTASRPLAPPPVQTKALTSHSPAQYNPSPPPRSPTHGKHTSTDSETRERSVLGSLATLPSYAISVRSTASTASPTGSAQSCSIPSSPAKSRGSSPPMSPHSVASLRRVPFAQGSFDITDVSHHLHQPQEPHVLTMPAGLGVLAPSEVVEALENLSRSPSPCPLASIVEVPVSLSTSRAALPKPLPVTTILSVGDGISMGFEGGLQALGSPMHQSSDGGRETRLGQIMTLVIRMPVNGKLKEVEFDFNLATDNPVSVAREMVTELGIPEDEMDDLARRIAVLKEEQVAKRNARREARAAAAALAGKHQVVQPQHQPAHPMAPSIMPDARSITPPLVFPQPVSQPALCPHVTSAPALHRAVSPPVVPHGRRKPVERAESSASATKPPLQPSCHHNSALSSRNRSQSVGSHLHQLQCPHRVPSSAPSSAGLTSSAPVPPTRTSSNPSLHSRAYSANSITSSSTKMSASAQGSSRDLMHRCSTGSMNLPGITRSTSGDTLEEELECVTVTDGSDSDDDDEADPELQRLKQEYLKSVSRAQKAFKARMESWEKCREEKEKDHRRLLEKFEKDMAEFNRRLHTAEDERLHRLHEMREQWQLALELHRERVRSSQRAAGASPAATT